MTPTLETDRLILRPVTFDDAPALQKHFNDWDIIKFIGGHVPWPYPDDGAETFLTEYCFPKMKDEEHFYLWTITLKGEDKSVGMLEYRFLADKDDNRGFWIAKHLWGQGLMSEAVNATQDYIFLEKGYPRIIVKNAASNEGSRRVKEKSGARQIGTAQGTYHIEDQTEEIWEITRESWAKFRGVPLETLPDTPDTLPPNHLFPPQEKKTSTS